MNLFGWMLQEKRPAARAGIAAAYAVGEQLDFHTLRLPMAVHGPIEEGAYLESVGGNTFRMASRYFIPLTVSGSR
jgi:hypothetical protein